MATEAADYLGFRETPAGRPASTTSRLLSVMTEAEVPIRTATDAGSIQVSCCRAITNTFSAGGSDAIRIAVAGQGCGNGPSSSINPNTTSGWIRSFTAMTAEWRVIEFRKRRLRHDPEQQSGQRNIEQEEVHPRQAMLREAFDPATGEADEDQPEIRQCEIENVDHGGASFSSVFAPIGILNGPAHCKRLIHPFASSIGHNHGLFDEI